MMKITELKERVFNHGLITHDGIFHADDVFSTALIQLIIDDDTIYPKRLGMTSIPENFDGIIYDIGGGEFDHHKDDSLNQYYPDLNDGRGAIKLCSFGLLWDAFAEEAYGSDVAYRLLDFVKDIDEYDSRGYNLIQSSSSSISRIISCYNMAWDDESESSDKMFKEAVDVARSILKHKIDNALATNRLKDCFYKTPTKNQMKIFDRPGQWNMFYERGCVIIISPSTRKDGLIIRPLARSFLLPKTWIDKSRPDGCLYIDINRSFARFNSKEHAIDAATEFVNMVTNIYSIFQK